MWDRTHKMLILLNFAQKAYHSTPPHPWHSEEYSPMPQVTRVMRLEVGHIEDEAAGVRGRGGRLQQLRGGEGQVWLEAAQTRRPNVDSKLSFIIHEESRILHRWFTHPTDNNIRSI